MATLVLSTAGTLIGGPIGGAIGAFIGNTIDQALFAPKAGSGPRLDDLTVQSSAYGAPLPHLFGTIRAAGNLIWSSGLKETKNRSGGGKRSGGRATTYSYSASFAVALSARRIAGIGRIWGDGKLLRGAAGELTSECTLRVFTGDERQVPDPLIAAVEGASGAPAYRGIAYAVFEDLQLGDFANRIPNLSFEVIADEAAPTIGVILTALCASAGTRVASEGLGSTVQGFAAARNVPLGSWISSLSAISPIRVREHARVPLLSDAANATDVLVLPKFIVAARDPTSSESRPARSKSPGALTIGFLDPDRDYQAGLQRAFHSAADHNESHFELPAVISAGAAKRAAQELLARRWSQSVSAKRALSYRAMGLAPGDRIRLESGEEWEVRSTTLAAMVVELELQPIQEHGLQPVVADGGRPDREPDLPQGETRFHVLELPPIGGELPSAPRLWIAAGGTGPGWRRAEIWISRDAGSTWSSAGLASEGVAIGEAVSMLGVADCSRWDEQCSVDIELISDTMWLESRSPLSVLSGANLALVGDEIVQYRNAAPIAPRRFRISGLLRGRRATENAISGHAIGDRFVVLNDGLFALDQPLEAIQSQINVKLVAPNVHFLVAPATDHRITARALRPLAPVHLRADVLSGGEVRISWVRRSRTGFGWIDHVDAELAEARESYWLRCHANGSMFETECATSSLVLSPAQQTASFGALPAAIDVEVAQWSGATGFGEAANQSFLLVR